MITKRQSCLLAMLLAIAWNGCANDPPPPPQADRVVPDFARPSPLDADANVIRLAIWLDRGELNFNCVDQPYWQDITLTPTSVTTRRDDVVLLAEELHWHVGETVITLKGGEVTLDYKKSPTASGQLVFKPSAKYVKVFRDGKWVKGDTEVLVDMDAKTGKVLLF